VISIPTFISICQSGKIYASLNKNAAPATETVVAQYAIASGIATQLVGTISGSTGNYAATANAGKYNGQIS